MILIPFVIAVILIVLARQGENGLDLPIGPTTVVGQVALASTALMLVVFLSDASVAVAVPSGLVMLALGAYARWGRHDQGLLLAFPLVCGVAALILPALWD